jgi:hypothetical protein
MRSVFVSVVTCFLVALGAGGCGPGGGRCVTGSSQMCACPPDGRPGAQTCNAAGSFEPCVCAPAGDTGVVRDGGIDAHVPRCGIDLICVDTGPSLIEGGAEDAARIDAADPDDAAMVTDAAMRDAGLLDAAMRDAAMRDAGRDAGPTCAATGLVGSNCRGGLCSAGLTCNPEISGMTVQDLYSLRQGTLDDPAHPGYQGLETPADPLNAAPFNGLTGSLCVQQCDIAAVTDGCGTCATCSTALTQMPLVNSFGGVLALFAAGDRVYGDDTGLCRLDCAYDPTSAGVECASGQTCEAFTGTCVERCTTDVECNTVYGATYSGELVTIVAADGARTCTPSTGRCEAIGTAAAAVGDPCAAISDCAPGTGVCLNGGMCGELGCTDPTCGGAGICVGVNDHSALCIAGCNTATDCEPGNACQPLGAPVGGLSGYCLATCFDDTECRATETCTDDPATAAAGVCVPRCATPDGVGTAAGCAPDEYCRRDRTGAAHGFCRALGGFCDVDSGGSASADCGAAQICDELLASGGGAGFGGADIFGDGHCVNRCTTAASCAGLPGSTCVTSGALSGLCRTPCTTTCASPSQRCDTTVGFCVER